MFLRWDPVLAIAASVLVSLPPFPRPLEKSSTRRTKLKRKLSADTAPPPDHLTLVRAYAARFERTSTTRARARFPRQGVSLRADARRRRAAVCRAVGPDRVLAVGRGAPREEKPTHARRKEARRRPKKPTNARRKEASKTTERSPSTSPRPRVGIRSDDGTIGTSAMVSPARAVRSRNRPAAPREDAKPVAVVAVARRRRPPRFSRRASTPATNVAWSSRGDLRRAHFQRRLVEATTPPVRPSRRRRPAIERRAKSSVRTKGDGVSRCTPASVCFAPSVLRTSPLTLPREAVDPRRCTSHASATPGRPVPAPFDVDHERASATCDGADPISRRAPRRTSCSRCCARRRP